MCGANRNASRYSGNTTSMSGANPSGGGGSGPAGAGGGRRPPGGGDGDGTSGRKMVYVPSPKHGAKSYGNVSPEPKMDINFISINFDIRHTQENCSRSNNW